MAVLPEPIQNLIEAFQSLPGIGPKTASRLAFYLLRAPQGAAERLAQALLDLQKASGLCRICFNITLVGQEICDICADPLRDAGEICVVEEPLDVLMIERSGGYHGRYHVLHGVLSPIEGIGPSDLKIQALVDRVRHEDVREVIIATNPSMEGDATAAYLQHQLGPLGVKVTRLARGLPVGADIEYADPNTILRALAGRQELS
jgi:recombination protein RecR